MNLIKTLKGLPSRYEVKTNSRSATVDCPRENFLIIWSC